MKTFLSLIFAIACCAGVRLECDYDAPITDTLALHFQSSTDLVSWQVIGTVTNVQPFSNSVPVQLTGPMMFFRVVASNEWGTANSNILTSGPPGQVKVKIR